MNVVHIEGVAAYAGGSAPNVIFQLPADFAPVNEAVATGNLVIDTSGNVHANMLPQAGATVVKLYGEFYVPEHRAPGPPTL